MLNKLMPTVIVDRVGAKLDSRGRMIVMVPRIITRPGKYFGMLQWAQTSAEHIDSRIVEKLTKELAC